jgi:DNA-binding MarR family transcriptional regulator
MVQPAMRSDARVPVSTETARALDRVLELLERRQLPATELRVLLRLVDREASLSELAEVLSHRPIDITRAGRSLAMRGLVRWRHLGRRKETRLGITAAGLATIRALLTAASHDAREVETPKHHAPCSVMIVREG